MLTADANVAVPEQRPAPRERVSFSPEFLADMTALLARHGCVPDRAPAAFAIGYAGTELAAFVTAYRTAPRPDPEGPRS